MKSVDVNDLGTYLRRMAIYGYMIEIDTEPLNRLSMELSRMLISLQKEPMKQAVSMKMT